jgi:cytochrome c biogenesis protein
MSHATRSATLKTPPPITELDADVALSPSGVLDWLWATFTSMRLALALMLGMAALALIGSIVIQVPPGIASDQGAYAEWLQGLKPRYGGFTTIFDKLGLFAVFQSVWFRALAAGLTTSILACSIKRAPMLWNAAVHPRTRVSDSFYESAPYSASVATTAAQAVAAATTSAVFRANRYRTIVEPRDKRTQTTHIYVDQHRWAPFGTVIAHLSVVVILAGAMIGSMFGYRDEGFAIPVGSTVAVGGGTDLSVEVSSFSDSYYDSGAPSDFASSLVLYRGGSEVARKTIRVNDPLEYGGVSFYQSFFGPAAVLSVVDAAGNTVFADGVPLLWSSDDAARRIGRFNLQGAGVIVYVVGAASGRVDPNIRAGQMQLEVYRSGADQPFAIETLSQGQPLLIGDLTYTFDREQQFTGLIVARDPGQVLVWIGALFLILGVFLVFMFPNRRMWVAINAARDGRGEVRLGATARHDTTFAPEFKKLVEQVRLAVGPAA